MRFTAGSDDLYRESLALHARYRGKLEIRSKVPFRNRYDLARAILPVLLKSAAGSHRTGTWRTATPSRQIPLRS